MNILLIDLDGVLRVEGRPASGINEFLSYIYNSNRPACVISNSTLTNAEMVKIFFDKNDIDFRIPIMTCADAAFNFVKNNFNTAAVYCSEPVKSMFNQIPESGNPDAVVIGDMGREWNYEIINKIFKQVYSGSKLIAMQKNRYWSNVEDGLLIDAGAFVTAIEYAAQTEALLIGKPSPHYFYEALNTLGFEHSQKFIILGDDLETDIQEAHNLGSASILIYTGKTKFPYNKTGGIKPTYEAQNLIEAIKILEQVK